MINIFTKNRSKQKVEEILALADIKINGGRSFDIQVHNDAFYDTVLASGSLGFGESYMSRWWDCEDIPKLIVKIFAADLSEKIKTFAVAKTILKAKIINLQKKSRAFEVGVKHYDIGNDLYKSMLDKRLTYTCGYWKNTTDLDDAQEKKLDLVCQKIGIKKGMRVLDIGCGWGSFAKYAAEKYGAHVTGITVSKEQVVLAKELCKNLPVKILLQDYRDVCGEFDRVVSLGMFEHVGYKNYRTFMKVVNSCLDKDGLFLLHTIACDVSTTTTDPWIEKYIFPNSMIPSAVQITTALEKLFVIEDWHNFGHDYSKTLLVWFNNFNNNWIKLKNKYDERFYRMWKFYLLSCAGSFQARKNQLWQIVASKQGVHGGYNSIR